MSRKNTVVAVALAAVLGCSSDGTGPTSLVGQLLFAYSGGITGTFDLSAPAYSAATPQASYVAGQLDAADGMFYAIGSFEKGGGVRDFAMIGIPRTTPGTATITSSCTGVACADLMFLVSQSFTGGGSIAQFCTLTTGSVAITTLSASRATGTFSGTGTCIASGGASTAFTVTGGTFDVALVADTPDT